MMDIAITETMRGQMLDCVDLTIAINHLISIYSSFLLIVKLISAPLSILLTRLDVYFYSDGRWLFLFSLKHFL